MYVERMNYGRYVAKTQGETISGAYYSFPRPNGGYSIGGKHNYREITKWQFILLSIKYWFLKNVFKATYKRIVKISWQD